MTQPLTSRLEGMLQAVYPTLDCGALANDLLGAMALARISHEKAA